MNFVAPLRPSAKGTLSDPIRIVASKESVFTCLRVSDDRSSKHCSRKEGPAGEENRHQEVAPGADETPHPGKKDHMEHHASDVAKVPDEEAAEGTAET